MKRFASPLSRPSNFKSGGQIQKNRQALAPMSATW